MISTLLSLMSANTNSWGSSLILSLIVLSLRALPIPRKIPMPLLDQPSRTMMWMMTGALRFFQEPLSARTAMASLFLPSSLKLNGILSTTAKARGSKSLLMTRRISRRKLVCWRIRFSKNQVTGDWTLVHGCLRLEYVQEMKITNVCIL
ncbi:hypothetical protein B0H11DRAFT_2027304 [Mycena galericulata]|nr:hypothetical protein B0H11DRAFT_2027304 [Mycena galericulata]